jgi:predicted RNase H-like nuclease (RuvC/YqgF family)
LEYSTDRTVEGRLNEEPTQEYNFNTEGMGVAITSEDDSSNNTGNEVIELRQKVKFLNDALSHFKQENSSLRKKIEEYEKMPNNDALINTIDLLKKENKELMEQNAVASDLVETLQKTIAEGNDSSSTKKVEPKKDWLLHK